MNAEKEYHKCAKVNYLFECFIDSFKDNLEKLESARIRHSLTISEYNRLIEDMAKYVLTHRKNGGQA